MAAGANILIQEWALDNSFIRFALAALIPLLFSVSLVSNIDIFQDFVETLDTGCSIVFLVTAGSKHLLCVSELNEVPYRQTHKCYLSIGPIAQYHRNSKYYSAIPPKPNERVDNNLPHITIQMPVYKESLDQVLYVTNYCYHLHLF